MASKKIFYLDGPGMVSLLESFIKDYSVFSPVERGSDKHGKADFAYKRLSKPEDFLFNPYRPLEPLKSFFTPYIEKVADYFGDNDESQHEKPSVILGLKACDLEAHKVQDYVFLEGVEEDPPYRQRRDNILIVSGDCTDFKEVCFCIAMGGKPYPEAGFDLNFSPMADKGFLVESGSPKGDAVIQKNSSLFVEADEEQLAERDDKRDKITERLKNRLEPLELPDYRKLQELVKSGMDRDTWGRFALTCVECGGCNFICDTCHCFLLSDNKSGSSNMKVRLWDSCQYKNFAAVAGGGNPMKRRGERLRNRFLKKFDFFVENMGKPACCGCGRCIEVCPGEIDIREVLKDLKE
jgi:sulfhydrogenase subunit beta (sulfur reductase)